MFHSNPLPAEGLHAFTDFGWDVLSELHKAKFDDIAVNIYADQE